MSTPQPNGVAASRTLVTESPGPESPAPEGPTTETLVTASLVGRFDAWRRTAAWQHLAAILLLALVLALRWWRQVTTEMALNDEIIYLNAFRNVVNGLSPFDRSGYLSFSLLARVGGWWLEQFGQTSTLVTLRCANLLGVATAVWCSLAWAPGTARRRWMVAALYLLVAPAVSFGMFVSNLSLAVSGMIVSSLMIWPRRPLASGTLLAGSIVAKPLAPGAVLALLVHRPAERTRANLLAAGCAIALTAAVALGSPELDRALAIDPWPRLGRTVSPHKLGWLLGWRGATPYISAVVALITVWLARRRPLGPTQLLGLAVAAAVSITPVVWSHTLLLTLPLQVVALGILGARYSGSRGGRPDAPEGHRRRLEIGAVLLAVAAIQFSTGATNIYDYPAIIQWVGLLAPMLAPWFLVGYVLREPPF